MSDVVNSAAGKKPSDGLWGIEGYEVPKFRAYNESPLKFNASKSKKETFVDQAIKAKNFLPPPYDTAGSLINIKRHSNLSKCARITPSFQIENDEKKFSKPGPGTYD